MIPGTNTFKFLITDILGTAVPAISSGFSILGNVAGNNITLSSVTSDVSGFYNVVTTIPNAGSGFIKLLNSNPNYFISPEYYSLEVENYSVDTVYAKLNAVGIANLPSGSSSRFTVVNLSVKEDSSIDEVIQLSSQFTPLTGYTDFSVQCFSNSALTASTTPLSGTYSCSVSNISAGLVTINIGNDVLQNLIPVGSTTAIIYGDIACKNASGKIKKPVELNITVRRSFNNNL